VFTSISTALTWGGGADDFIMTFATRRGQDALQDTTRLAGLGILQNKNKNFDDLLVEFDSIMVQGTSED